MKILPKKYILVWSSLTEGKVNFKRPIVTNNPQNALFDFACKMIVMANFWFNKFRVESIKKNILKGKVGREHYFIEFDNGEVQIVRLRLTNPKP